jgi:hypothetical protein
MRGSLPTVKALNRPISTIGRRPTVGRTTENRGGPPAAAGPAATAICPAREETDLLILDGFDKMERLGWSSV